MPPKHGPDGRAINTGMFFHDGPAHFALWGDPHRNCAVLTILDSARQKTGGETWERRGLLSRFAKTSPQRHVTITQVA